MENLPSKSKLDIYLTSSKDPIFFGYKEDFEGLNNFISLGSHSNKISDLVRTILPTNSEYSTRELYIYSDSESSSIQKM